MSPFLPGSKQAVKRNPPLKYGESAPDFACRKVEGSEAKSSDAAGKIRVIDFCGTSCGPFIAAMPKVEALYQKSKDQDAAFPVLAVRDELESFDSWIAKAKDKYHYPFSFDETGERRTSGGISDLCGDYASPTQYIIDQDDRIALVVQGLTGTNAEKIVAKLKELGVKLD